MFIYWLWEQKSQNTTELSKIDTNNILTYFQNFRPFITIDKIQDQFDHNEDDLHTLIERLNLNEEVQDSGIIKVKQEPK